MKTKLRIARATNNLHLTAKMYIDGLGLKKLGSFENHKGFDGIIIGDQDCDYHFEFTQENGRTTMQSDSDENSVVFYIPDPSLFESRKLAMTAAGFKRVKSHNPYWDENGITFADFENFRVVFCKNQWNLD